MQCFSVIAASNRIRISMDSIPRHAIHLAWMEAPSGHQTRRLFYIAARHRACLGGSVVWFSDVPGSQIRFHVGEPVWKVA